MYVKSPFKIKCQLVINEREKVGIKQTKKLKALIDYSQTINVYEHLEDYNPTKKTKFLIVYDNMIADMEANKKLSLIVTELFLRGRKLNISLVWYDQLISKCLKL